MFCATWHGWESLHTFTLHPPCVHPSYLHIDTVPWISTVKSGHIKHRVAPIGLFAYGLAGHWEKIEIHVGFHVFTLSITFVCTKNESILVSVFSCHDCLQWNIFVYNQYQIFSWIDRWPWLGRRWGEISLAKPRLIILMMRWLSVRHGVTWPGH